MRRSEGGRRRLQIGHGWGCAAAADVNSAVGDQVVLVGKTLAEEGTKAACVGAGAFGILGLAAGVWGVQGGIKKIRTKDEFEEELTEYVQALRAQCDRIREHSSLFASSVPRRGRLTYVNGGGACARWMEVAFRAATGEEMTIQSDKTHVVKLPLGASDIKIRFGVIAGTVVKKVNRHHCEQPWITPTEVEKINIASGNGVDAVFEVRGTSCHSFVHRAWDFGNDGSGMRGEWEWCGNSDQQNNDCATLLASAKEYWQQHIHVHISNTGKKL